MLRTGLIRQLELFGIVPIVVKTSQDNPRDLLNILESKSIILRA